MVTPEQELRAAAGALMLTARAKRGKVMVEEWAAIRLLHLLPEIYQVPHIAENGEGTWTTEPAPPGRRLYRRSAVREMGG